MKPVTAGEIASWTASAVAEVDADDLAYLALTGKAELQIRDYLAMWCRRSLDDLVAAREWKRHDFALLRGRTPVAIIEGKLWASFNVLNHKKLNSGHPSHGILGAMQKDMTKLVERSKTESMVGFVSTLLMGINVSDVHPDDQEIVKYLSDWKKSLKSGHNWLDQHSKAHQALMEFSSRFGETESAQLFRGTAYGAEVVMSVVVTRTV